MVGTGAGLAVLEESIRVAMTVLGDSLLEGLLVTDPAAVGLLALQSVPDGNRFRRC